MQSRFKQQIGHPSFLWSRLHNYPARIQIAFDEMQIAGTSYAFSTLFPCITGSLLAVVL